MNRLVCFIIALLAALCLFFWQRSITAQEELTSLRGVFTKAQIQGLAANLKITTAVLAERDKAYADVHSIGKEAVVIIEKAQSASNEVDIDAPFPLPVSDSLVMQYERICAGSAICLPAGSVLGREASTHSTSRKGAKNDTTAAVGVVQ